ncbi:MAG: Tim44 domain-containing protein [OCS116 cluster bacterium]|uniref:Tim44-like domain-containing protein n=1 Tax=OCS116 cluster bacterium TaxID=2030921 RepID=A0A2A4YTV1_9PROT|nr:Tim44 domain-containing protein [OCS116 cluster bacterium]
MGSLLNILVPILAVFLVYKLFTTLGKNGEDSQDMNAQDDRNKPLDNDQDGSNVIKLPTAAKSKTSNAARPDPVEILASAMDTENFASADDKAKEGLKTIIMAHPSFDYREFMNGAEVAYEMINLGFAQNDRDILQRLLTPSVYESFNGVITAREKAGHRVHARFVGYERVQMKDAVLDGNIIRLTVHFVGKLVSTTYDANDHIIDGNEKHIFNTNDVWTFESDMSNEKTSWQLAATAKGE